MPDWCQNRWDVTFESAEDKAAFKAAAFNDDDELDFQKLMPMPDSLKDDGWYRWRVENWGTKWQPSDFELDDDNEDFMRFTFETAWQPPDGIYKLLRERFPDVDIVAFYDCYPHFAGYLDC